MDFRKDVVAKRKRDEDRASVANVGCMFLDDNLDPDEIHERRDPDKNLYQYRERDREKLKDRQTNISSRYRQIFIEW